MKIKLNNEVTDIIKNNTNSNVTGIKIVSNIIKKINDDPSIQLGHRNYSVHHNWYDQNWHGTDWLEHQDYEG